MRHFSYCDYSESNNDDIKTFSEKEIFDQYYPYWCFLIKKKYLKEGKNPPTEEVLCFDHCLDDWITTNYAWEIKT